MNNNHPLTIKLTQVSYALHAAIAVLFPLILALLFYFVKPSDLVAPVGSVVHIAVFFTNLNVVSMVAVLLLSILLKQRLLYLLAVFTGLVLAHTVLPTHFPPYFNGIFLFLYAMSTIAAYLLQFKYEDILSNLSEALSPDPECVSDEHDTESASSNDTDYRT